MTAPEFRDPQAQRIYQRLLQIGQGAAAFFADAYRLVEDDHSLQARTHVIAHLLRELESSVRTVLAAATGVPPKEACEKGYMARSIAHIIDELGFEGKDPIASGWTDLSLHKLAHRSSLDPPRDFREIERTWSTTLGVLDALLDRFEARYADTYQRLDRLLKLDQPTREAARELRETIPRTPPTLRYFFSQVTNPRWFPLLVRRWSVLREAPPPVIDDKAGTIHFPAWPAAQYLGRMTSDFPEDIAEILDELDTNNVRAQSEAIEIAALLPMEHVLEVADRVQSWIPDIRRFQFPCEALFDLVIRLADEGHPSTAISCLDQLLATPTESDGRDDRTRSIHEDVSYDFEMRAKPVFDALARVDGQATIELIAGHLERRIFGDSITGLGTEVPQLGTPDYSTTWLPSLHSKAPRYRGSMRPFLASYLLLALDTAVAELGTNGIIELLRARRTMLFRRIELDFLARHVEQAEEHVTQRLMDRAVFEASDLRAEYADLFAAGFPKLSNRHQETLLGWIDEGLDHWEEMDSDQVATWRMTWKRDWLALVEPHLDDERRHALRELVDETGAPEPFHRIQAMAHFVGPNSPVDVDAMKTMSVEDILDLLRTWSPDDSPDSDSRAGLCEVLSTTVADDPERFVEKAVAFSYLHYTYRHAFLSGLGKGFRDDRQFEWGPVLDLAEVLVAEAIDQDSTDDGEVDSLTMWNAAKRSTIDLLNLGLSLGDRTIPTVRAEQVWGLIESLADDEDPTAAREEKWIGEDSDPSSLALNSVRPRVISAAIRYAFWKNAAATSDDPIGFEALPRVSALLQQHLDPEREPSMAVRSVFGQELSRLIWFDREWVEVNRELLFPRDSVKERHRAAVFEGHLRYGGLRDGLLPILADEYENAIRGATQSGAESGPHSPERKVAQHVMLLFAFGQLELETGLVPLFFSEAPDEVRKEALHFLGWWLSRRASSGVETSVAERLKKLWDFRVENLEHALARGNAPSARAELMEFGWWFASGAFDAAWSLRKLQQVLELCGKTVWDRQVAKRLAELVDDHPADVIETIKLVDLHGGGDPGYAIHWREHVRTIFAATLSHEDAVVRQDATELVNRWIAYGHTELRDLLPPGTEA